MREIILKDETESFLRFFLGCKRRFKKLNKERLKEYQINNARRVVKFAIKNAPFFKKHYNNCDKNDVWNLPTTNKNTMMENLSNYNTMGFDKQEMLNFCLEVEQTKNYNIRFKGYNLAMSSGTSGNKGIVITSPAEEKYLQAALFARFPFPRIIRLKWAFMLRITTPAFNVSKFGQKLTYISLSKPIEAIRSELEHMNPNILSAPPSMLQIIASEIKESRLHIKPKRIISYAEVLSDDVKKNLEEIFDLKIFQIYQSSEGPIGMPCKYGNLHINEDLVYIQALNSDGDNVSPGNPCTKMIITDLHKKSQPIIRFELNDIITISSDPCRCGSSFRIIERIGGRADDMFWAIRKESSLSQYIFPDYIRRAIISSSDEIKEYQAVQKDESHVLVRILTISKEAIREIISKKIEENIKNLFASYNCVQPNVKVIFEKPIFNPNSSKLIRIHRDFQPDF